MPGLSSPYPLEAPRLGPPDGDDTLARLHAALGVETPADYRTFMKACGPIMAMDLFNGYQIYDAGMAERMWRAREVPVDLVLDDGETSALPFGGDGGGNQFLLLLSGSRRGEVLKWSHDIPADDGRLDLAQVPERDRRWALTLLAPDFVGFLQRLADDWQHFVEGDDAWSYMSG